MGKTLLYAADLIPEIADDIVNIDNAMKWGFAWRKGPFEILDELNPILVIEYDNNQIKYLKCSNLKKILGKELFILMIKNF